MKTHATIQFSMLFRKSYKQHIECSTSTQWVKNILYSRTIITRKKITKLEKILLEFVSVKERNNNKTKKYCSKVTLTI